MNLGIDNRVALVFGSSQGIGYAIAQSLAREGARVVLSSRNAERLARAQEEIAAAQTMVCDLTQPGAAAQVVKTVIATFGRLDILVINSGGPEKGRFLDVTRAQWEVDFQNLWLSTVEAIQAALPKMTEEKWGRILLITSIAAREPLPSLTTSNSLRAGLEGLVKSLSHEVANLGVTVNIVMPGYTATDRLRELNLSEERIRQMVPAGRLADPSEVGDLATFILSARASYLTGQSIALDGGALRGR